MKDRFDLIIFDWDGTLVDSIDWIVHCIQQAAARYGCPVPARQAAKDIIGLSIENAIETLFPDVDSRTRQHLAEHYGQMFFSRQISPEDLFPGVHAMLVKLRQGGCRLAIATGKKSSGLAQAIVATGVAELFDASRCSDQTASKPDPLMIDQIIAELNADRRRTLMVGDSVHDLQMAINAEVASVAVTCGAHSAATLQQYRPLLCLNYPTDLLAFF
ncbi:MAG: HAD-IA family hydrolase [Methylococcales bacterium]|nr:HAD-IA family hydrolase [Methylococcales bacterium]